MSAPAIQVSHLSKEYVLGARQRYVMLRDSLSGFFKKAGRGREEPQILRALDDVTLDIARGSVVGIIGRNGAGKSTLLKVLSRITEPSQGYVELRGRVGSLLEVGSGFHPELTGRENVFLNGAILGMRQAEVLRKFDEIVAFAEVEKFIDTPVKHYSSGMFMRLAFAVAAHLEPDILLVDEVLAVGDADFRRKCMGKMGDLPNSGRTVLFVSHSMSAISGLCREVIWLDKGAVRMRGAPDEVITGYLDSLQSGAVSFAPGRDFHLEHVLLKDAAGRAVMTIAPKDPLTVEVAYRTPKRHETVYFRVIVAGPGGYLFGADMLLDGCLDLIEGSQSVVCRFDSVDLMPGTYTVLFGVIDRSGRDYLFQLQEASSFHVVGNLHDVGLMGELANTARPRTPPMLSAYTWRLPDGSERRVPDPRKTGA